MSKIPVTGRVLLAASAIAAATFSILVTRTASPAAAQPSGAQAIEPLAVADSLDRAIHSANMATDPHALVQARAFAQRALTRYPDHPMITVQLAQTYYREAYLRMATDQRAGQELLSEAQALLEKAVQHGDAPPETHAMLSAVIGMRITNPLRGITMGRRSDAAMQQAVRRGPHNPRVWLMHGIGTLHKPAIAGGGIDAALDQLNRADSLFRTDRRTHGAPGWGQAEVQAWIGVAHRRANRPAEARAAWIKALQVEPEYRWVKYILLPSLQVGSTGAVEAALGRPPSPGTRAPT